MITIQVYKRAILFRLTDALGENKSKYINPDDRNYFCEQKSLALLDVPMKNDQGLHNLM